MGKKIIFLSHEDSDVFQPLALALRIQWNLKNKSQSYRVSTNFYYVFKRTNKYDNQAKETGAPLIYQTLFHNTL